MNRTVICECGAGALIHILTVTRPYGFLNFAVRRKPDTHGPVLMESSVVALLVNFTGQANPRVGRLCTLPPGKVGCGAFRHQAMPTLIGGL